MSDIIKISQLTEFDSTLNSINTQQVYIPIAYEKNTYKLRLDKVQSENGIKASLNDLQNKYEDIFENMSGEDNGDWEVIYKCTKGKYYDENTNTYEDEIYPDEGIVKDTPEFEIETKDSESASAESLQKNNEKDPEADKSKEPGFEFV